MKKFKKKWYTQKAPVMVVLLTQEITKCSLIVFQITLLFQECI